MGITEKHTELDWVQSQNVMYSGITSIYDSPRFQEIYKITIQIEHLLIKVIYSPFLDYKYAHLVNDHLMLYPNLQIVETFVITVYLHSFDIKGSYTLF